MTNEDINTEFTVPALKNHSITFEQYKTVYYDEIKSSIGILIITFFMALCLSYLLFLSESSVLKVAALLLPISLLSLPLNNIRRAIANLRAQKIIIEKDLLITTYGKLNWGEISNFAQFETHKEIALHGPKLQAILQYSDQTPVYIIKTGKTKEILDILPIQSIPLEK
jgi:hypothetical protein